MGRTSDRAEKPRALVQTSTLTSALVKLPELALGRLNTTLRDVVRRGRTHRVWGDFHGVSSSSWEGILEICGGTVARFLALAWRNSGPWWLGHTMPQNLCVPPLLIVARPSV